MTEQPTQWHKGAVIYQIYPRSFFDNGDSGIGNLKGITAKLDYLGGSAESLGITAIWISPIYTSPMADFGYDVADYNDVDPIFGNIADFIILVREAHHRNIKVILDFVPNHSSDEHAWFKESKASLVNPKRDWYVWRAPRADGGPPNNWLSVFGGSAWEFSEPTQQYYLHSFLAKQPDLNWDNPAVRDAMKSAMRFWLDKGVDGFRVDAVDWLSKDAQLRDDPVAEDAGTTDQDYGRLKHTYSREGPHLFDRLNEMTEVLDEYHDRFMITEAHPETQDKIQGYLQYYQTVNSRLSAPFNFEGIHLPWEAQAFHQFVDNFQAAMKPHYIPIYNVGNHDESRIASRVGRPAARVAAMMLLTLPGLPFIYYGDELGMIDVAIAEDQIRDPFTAPGQGRDPQRTPMQWNDSEHAGFTAGQPWLPLAPDYRVVNVRAQAQDPTSSFSLYRRLIHYRNHSTILKNGVYRSIEVSQHIFGYEKSLGPDKLLILLNFSGDTQPVSIEGLHGVVVFSTYLDNDGTVITGPLELRPDEGLMIHVKND